MNSIMRFLICFIPLLLVGCSNIMSSSFVKHRQKSYLYAQSIPPLRIPAGISSGAFHNEYPVSDRAFPESAKDVSLVPPGLAQS